MGAKARLSETGEITLPQVLRDAYGLKPGTEIDIVDDGQRIVITPAAGQGAGDASKKLTLKEFLALRVTYDGPPITDDMMHEAIDQAAIEDWERLERQWNDKKDD